MVFYNKMFYKWTVNAFYIDNTAINNMKHKKICNEPFPYYHLFNSTYFI